MTALERTTMAHSGEPLQPGNTTAPDDTTGQVTTERDYTGYLARFLLLLAALGVAYGLDHVADGRPYFGFLVLGGVSLVGIGLVLGPRSQVRSGRIAVPLFDLAWLTFTMYLADGALSIVLSLLYIIVAMATMRSNRWEIGTTVAGTITAVFILVSTHKTGTTLTLAVAQASLLAAGALTIRLVINDALPAVVSGENDQLYHTLLLKTSDAVLALDPDTWEVIEANPAAVELFGPTAGQKLTNRPLDEVIQFSDRAFPKTCRQLLTSKAAVDDAVTYALGPDGQRLILRCNLQKMATGDRPEFIQAIIEVAEEQKDLPPVRRAETEDFAVNYIPSLSHELNNHLAAIRLSAELAAATGTTPDLDEIQHQVDRCQEVLQTVVLQVLRSSKAPSADAPVPEADLKSVVERVLLLTRPQVMTNSVQVQVEVPDGLPAVIGFSHELQEALIRLVVLSLKTMVGRDLVRSLSFSAQLRPHGVELVVEGAGPGLTAHEIAVVSGKFGVVSRPEDRTWEVVRDAFCRFGGDIQASNGLNGGVRFRVTLPLYAQQQVVA